MKSEGNNATMKHMHPATPYLPVTSFYGPRVLCILWRSIQLWHATLLACKWGKTLGLSKFMAEIRQLDEEFQQKAANYHKMEILELEIK